MEITDLIQNIDAVILASDTANAAAANTARRCMFQRVFEEGRKADGSKIGNYSTKPTLVGDSSFLTKTGAQKVLGSKAKRAKLDWVTLSGGRKLAVLEGGYKEIRDTEGRQTAFIDLLYSGNLSNDLSAVPIEDGFEMGFFTVESAKKVVGNESRFGDIFSLSEDEIDKVINTYTREVFRAID